MLGACQAPARTSVVNISDAGHTRTIMQVLASSYDWHLQPETSATADIYIVVKEDDISRRLQCLKRRQRMSRIPGMRDVCKKVPFAMLMRRMQAMDPERFDFWPQTYIVPDESIPQGPPQGPAHLHLINTAFNKALINPLIFKPDDGCGGDGIVILMTTSDLARKVRALKKDCSAVVQEYISRPLLLKGFKWDIRVYVLLLSLEPLRAFLCCEGLARVCSEAYAEPTMRTSHKVTCHLTNYSINKFGTNYDHVDDASDGTAGTKRTLSSTMAFLERLGHDARAFYKQIHHIASATVRAVASEFDGCDARERQNCFHILGLDVMFDEDGKAWLLEVNSSPSLSIDSVYPAEGPYAESPAQVLEGTPYAPLMHAAKLAMGRSARELCKCSSHHRPHLHAPCCVDLVAKIGTLAGALEIVRRDMVMAPTGLRTCAELVVGTCFEELRCSDVKIK